MINLAMGAVLDDNQIEAEQQSLISGLSSSGSKEGTEGTATGLASTDTGEASAIITLNLCHFCICTRSSITTQTLIKLNV